MYAFTVATSWKCRATSSMTPRYAKRGASTIRTAGICQPPGAGSTSWPSVCTP